MSERPTETEAYATIRGESPRERASRESLWFAMRDWMKDGGPAWSTLPAFAAYKNAVLESVRADADELRGLLVEYMAGLDERLVKIAEYDPDWKPEDAPIYDWEQRVRAAIEKAAT